MSSVSRSAWYDSLLAALGAARYTPDEVRARVSAELGDEPEWLADALSGSAAPSAYGYLILSAVTSIPISVLAGTVDPARSTGVALRAGTLANPSAITGQAQRRGVQLIEASRLICSWLGADAAAKASHLAAARAVISRDAFAPHAGRNTAQQVRAMLDRLGLVQRSGPVGDLVALVESLGIPVELSSDLPEGIHGITVHDESLGNWDCAIIIRVQDFWVRQRYTLAHELCHVLYRDSGLVSVNDDGIEDSTQDEESRAEFFARHFLAPAPEARRVWLSNLRASRGDSVRALCEFMLHFGISRQAALRILQSGQLISAEAADNLRQRLVADQMESSGLGQVWQDLVDEQSEPSASVWLLEAALNLYQQELVPVGVVASVLGQPEEAVRVDLRAQGWHANSGI
ncbi:ImmA/IrrE family metallo-endopeptidase [Micromonospora globispora]|uniref:ImmA/IrrE family metallo-endopeptidase n=1 Tax=Micromonospora globispora TaxID=1450148 RepID=UPI000F5F5298|nr:ImmA/IrrE family metallo-endopeptidase [Micromonospora globispora]RQW99445.1 hypothetical protein DKL51_08525 [Micromonospora globispora]